MELVKLTNKATRKEYFLTELQPKGIFQYDEDVTKAKQFYSAAAGISILKSYGWDSLYNIQLVTGHIVNSISSINKSMKR